MSRELPGPQEEAGRRSRGIAAYASQFGIEPSEVVAHMTGLLGARMAEEAIHATGGGAWEADELSLRDRSIAVVAALITQGGVESRLRGHIRWAVEHDVSPSALEALVTLLANYVGYPRASVAMEVVRAEIAQMGLSFDGPTGSGRDASSPAGGLAPAPAGEDGPPTRRVPRDAR
jgi:4-carboxymuconolactone decarboxylase